MRIAVVGSGISGIASAWLLSRTHTVDLYEADARLGGHTYTIDVDTGAGPFTVDTGFQVFNRRTYPNLTRFFRHLGIDAVDADMSFSVQVKEAGIEWSGTDLNTVFAQRANLVRPAFVRMVRDILRFSRDADRLLQDAETHEMTLGELIEREGYSHEFGAWYLVPMGAAIWSTPPGEMLDYPAATFLHFCENHGLLHVTGKPLWLSVPGGARRYIEAAIPSISGEVLAGTPVTRVKRLQTGVAVTSRAGTREYDAVVLATHPPQSLQILGEEATPQERAVLSAITYRDNDIVVHTDRSFMPENERAWASWNYYSEHSAIEDQQLVLTYHINTLQQLPEGTPAVMETLNRDREPTSGSVLAKFSLAHPMYSRAALAAQGQLHTIQGTDRVWFAGAWTRYGFHEDGILSAVRVSEALSAPLPWGEELDTTRTRVRPGVEPPMLGQTRKLQSTEYPLVAEDGAEA